MFRQHTHLLHAPTLLCVCACRYGYLQSLPGREYVPMFWTKGELQLLKGTELEGRADEDRYGEKVWK